MGTKVWWQRWVAGATVLAVGCGGDGTGDGPWLDAAWGEAFGAGEAGAVGGAADAGPGDGRRGGEAGSGAATAAGGVRSTPRAGEPAQGPQPVIPVPGSSGAGHLGWLAVTPYGAVLDARAATATLADGDLELVEDGSSGRIVVRRDVDLAGLPMAWRGLVGHRLALYAGTAAAGTATVRKLALLSMTAAYGPEPEDVEDDEAAHEAETLADADTHGWPVRPADPDAASQAEAIATVLDDPDATHLLVAELEGAAGDATWARSADLPPPALAGIATASPALVAEAMRRLQDLPDWRAVQARFAADSPADADPGPWHAAANLRRDVQLVRGHGEALLFVDVWAHAGAFSGQLRVLWRLTGDLDRPQTLHFEPRGAPELGYRWTVAGGADVDGDGEMDLLLDGGVLRGDKAAIEAVELPLAEEGC